MLTVQSKSREVMVIPWVPMKVNAQTLESTQWSVVIFKDLKNGYASHNLLNISTKMLITVTFIMPKN